MNLRALSLPCSGTCPRAMSTVPIPPKGMNQSPRTGDPDLDSELDLGLKIMEHDMKSPEFQDPVWGFVIYRCITGNDEAWEASLERLRTQISRQLQDKKLSQPRLDLLSSHHLHVIDEPKFYSPSDKPIFSGAPINKIRAHFNTWLLKDLHSRRLPGIPHFVPSAAYLAMSQTPRYTAFLVVDNECISLEKGMLKLVSQQWDYGDLEATHNLFWTSGGPDMGELDGGWFFLEISEYVRTYVLLQTPDLPV
ncbi:hypothetical protein VTL71DRAFT_11423 [Oculimacula yallundae]|uniref:Uncharacterized protein n=1 Tax=Oculimacula yallundae TaxID=86028 RepID=A0ABR4CQ44_9HELO